MKKIFILLIALSASFVANANRFYTQPFNPVSVTVADGHLQIKLPSDINSEMCSNKRVIVLPDDHKYFEAYLSIAMTALVSGSKINAAISGPCLTGNSWFQIANVLQLSK